MTAAEDPFAYWWRIPEEERENLNQMARESILQLDCYPYSNAEVAAELLAWSRLETDVLEAYGEWLSRTKAKFERRGWPWTTGELARRSHLWEHE